MDVEDVIREGRICGIDFFGVLDWTWGEVQEFVECTYERERRHYQKLSIIAARQATVICRTFSSGGMIDPVQDFQMFWTEQEKIDARIARLKHTMKG